MPIATAKDGTRLFYRDYGAGTPVVLVHGWPLNGDMFETMAIALAANGYRAIVPDRRGFGRSDQPFDGYDFDTLTSDLSRVIDDAGIVGQVALIGYSMGTGEVTRFQTRSPGRTSAAVLISPLVPAMLKSDSNPHGMPLAQFHLMMSQIGENRSRYMSELAGDVLGNAWAGRRGGDCDVAEFHRQSMMAGERATLKTAQAIASTDFGPDIPNFVSPTLVIHGTANKMMPIQATAQPLAEAIPGAELLEYEGRPHALHATDKVRLIDDIISFFDRTVGPARGQGDALPALSARAPETPLRSLRA